MHPSRDDLTAYALGALDPGEAGTVAEHATECERCATELRNLAPAVGVLAESVERYEPPPELRERLMATVHSEAVGQPARSSEGAGASRSRINFDGFVLGFATGLAALALGIAGVVGFLAGGDDGKEATTVAVEASQPGAGGSLVLESDAATLQVHGMPALDKGAVYQVWVEKGSVVRPSATFVPHEDGTATAAVPEVLGGGEQVTVTEEARPGRRTPTLPSLITASID